MQLFTDKDNWEKHWQDFSHATDLNPAQQYRRSLIIKQIRKLIRPFLTILDIGSGQGDLALELKTEFPNSPIFGVDLSQAGIDIAQKKIPTAHFFKMDLLAIPNPLPPPLARTIDIAICSEVLEHLDAPDLFLKNAAELLKPGATLIITVPRGPRSAYDNYLGHRTHFTVATLKRVLQSSGYEINTIVKAGFPFFNLYKMLVILRGKQLIADTKQQKISWLAKSMMWVFNLFFKINLPRSPWGWQLIAVAKCIKNQ